MLSPADIPNTICVIRMLLVVPAVWAIASEDYQWALALVFVAGASDAVDGYLAKRFGWRSRLGGLLDPLADKLLLVSLFIALAWHGLLPWWLAVIVIARDLIIVSGGLAYHLIVGPIDPAPSVLSKLNTAAQIFCVVVVLGGQALGFPPVSVRDAMEAAVALTSIASGLDYVVRWGRRALTVRA